MTYGITAWAAHTPRTGLESAIASAHQWDALSVKGRAEYWSWDEDIVSIEVEAARNSSSELNLRTIREARRASTMAAEMYYGAGAAAFLGGVQGVAGELLGSSSSTTLRVDHYWAVSASLGVAAVTVTGLH